MIETLSGLERRIELVLPVAGIENEVQAQLKCLAHTAKARGFRPGKAPLAILERSHGAGIRYDVISSQIGRAFDAAIGEAKLRVAGTPVIRPKIEAVADNTLAFTATFEVYPEISLPDISALTIKCNQTPVTEAEAGPALTLLGQQRAAFEIDANRAVQGSDCVTPGFAGALEDAPFEEAVAFDRPSTLVDNGVTYERGRRPSAKNVQVTV